jgi:hypothetical protein
MPVTPPTPDEEPGLPMVSREKERVIAPPRSAVPAPGAGPVFGRGFFRLFRESGAAGCFFLVFLAVGAALFLFGLAGTAGPYKEGLRENGDPRFFLAAMAFGTVFCLVTLRMMQVALTETANRSKKGSKAEPWTWDHPWRQDWMPPDYSGGGIGMVLGRVAFLALLGLFNAAWSSGNWVIRAVIVVFDLFGLLILYDSFQKLYQWLRFGRPVMIWETLPAFLGSQLRGRMAFARVVRAAGPPRLTLRCVRDEWVESGSSKNRTKSLEPQAIYQQTIEIPVSGPLDAIDFAFDVPSDLPGTDLSLSEAVYWQVLANIPLPGPNVETVFLAPVYRKR